MLHFEEGACRVAAGDTQSAFSGADEAYLASLRMAATIVETFKGSGMPAGTSQRVYEGLNASMAHFMEGRRELVSVVGRLQVLHAKSNQAEVSFGCPWFEALEPKVPARAQDRAAIAA